MAITPHTLIIGSIAYDTVDIRGHTHTGLGGAATYAALAASYLSRPYIVGAVGYDFQNTDKERLLEHGIDLTGLYTDPHHPTFTWHGRYQADCESRSTIALSLGAFEYFKPKLSELPKDIRHVLLANIDPDIQLQALQQLPKHTCIVTDTIDHWIHTKKDALLQVLKSTSVLIVNEAEACLLSSQVHSTSAGLWLLDQGPKAVIIKLGSKGSQLFHPNGHWALPAYPVTHIQDPTGAGDAFAGAFLGYIASQNQTTTPALQTAMYHGTILASFAIEAPSTMGLHSLTHPQIQERYALLQALSTSGPQPH